MKEKIKLGVVCLARKTFDYEAAKELYNDIQKNLTKLENVEIVAIKDLIIEVEDATKAAKELYQKNVDGIAIISGTFHLGHLALEIKKIADRPLLLWGLNELPYNGGKIRLNSVCGVNLNGSNLTKSGIKDFVYTIGENIDTDFIDALRMKKALKNSKIGILGYRAQGFFNLDVDDLAVYKKFGILIDHYELENLWNTEVQENMIKEYKEKFQQKFVCSSINDKQLYKVSELAAKFKTFMEKNSLNALAVRCWPEFAAGFSIAPCAAMSILGSEDYIIACEGDIDCAITMIAHRAAGAETPFMADLSQVNIEKNYALMWHCGVAPCNLTDGKCECTLDTYHAGGRGITAGFVMKEGPINMTRLDSIDGKYRLFNEKGIAKYMEKELSGTYAKVSFEHTMKQVLHRVIYTGVAHHVSMVYGDYSKAFEIFAKLMDIEVI